MWGSTQIGGTEQQLPFKIPRDVKWGAAMARFEPGITALCVEWLTIRIER